VVERESVASMHGRRGAADRDRDRGFADGRGG